MKNIYKAIVLTMSSLVLSSCEQFVDLDAPKTQIVNDKVFANDSGARAAVLGIFSQMISGSSFASGGTNGITVIAGLSSDELNNHSTSQNNIALFNNNLTSLNSTAVSANWNDMYLFIYECNSILEGIERSNGVSKAIADQVIGEAKFIRAFTYFYLINLYGDVPLLTTTDYRVNRLATRTPKSEVYEKIESDLMHSQKLLLGDYSYSGEEKVEPNKWAATALLARVLLYQKKWIDAEFHSSALIESKLFSLPSLSTVFLKNSEEAIWQLMPVLPGFNTNEAPILMITSNPTRVSISSSVIANFESGDNRASSWLGSFTTAGKTYRFASKYKVRLRDQPVTEYYTVLRLAEQYLIRAEARAMQDKLADAISDINVIRSRANLAPIDATGMSQQQVLDAIEHERRSELFVEWGHRWFDLKRSGKVDAVLGPAKPDWQPKDALFPLPQADINANPNLIQNP